MFKLILLFLLFVLLVVNYIFNYLDTIPYFHYIQQFNLYGYLLNVLSGENRQNYVSGVDYFELILGGKTYITNYTGINIKTDLKYLFKDGPSLNIYVPVFILHTGGNILFSGDKLFSSLSFLKNYIGYDQLISGGNNIIKIGEDAYHNIDIKSNIFFGKTYLYCSLTGVKWIDAYLYDRYLQWNISGNYKEEQTDSNYNYVCENDISYKACPSGYVECTDSSCVNECVKYSFGVPVNYTSKIYYCNCTSKIEYFLCKDIEPDGCDAYNKGCIDYYTGTIDLNKTNCSLSGLVGETFKAKYFLIR